MRNFLQSSRTILLVVIGLIFYSYSNAQITINNLTTLTNAQFANALVDSITGTGVTFSNASFQGVRLSSQGYQACYFTTAGATQTQMGLSKGIALTSGNTNLLSIPLGTNPGAANSFSKGYSSSVAGEIRKSTTSLPDMNLLAGSVNWFNGAILEFDFVPAGDSIFFKYVFGGEEYSDNTNFTNYQCTAYNDKFGFLISGPGINGAAGYSNNAKNIARLANGSEVGINSVNNGTVGSSATPNGASYCSSVNPAWVQGVPVAEYNGTIAGTAPNGNTKVLIAAHGGLTPGATYHIKMQILDASDGAYDAIVYIEAGSFSSPMPSVDMSAVPSTICNGESTYVVATAGSGTPPYTFNWSTGASNTSSNPKDSILVSPTSTTTYSITVTDNAAQQIFGSIDITVNPNLVPTFTQLGPYCQGAVPSSLPTTSTNSIAGTWSPASISTASAGTTIYTFTPNVTTCTSNATMNVVVNSLPNATITNNSGTTEINCTTTSINVTANGGGTYLWSGGSSTSTAANSLNSAGTYTVTVTSSGCTSTSAITITQNTTLPTANAGNDQTICSGSNVTLTATGGTSYNWDNGVTQSVAFSPLATNTYNVTVTGANGCTATDNVLVTVNPLPVASVNPTTTSVCNGASATLTASGGTSFLWSNGSSSPSISVSPTVNTTYYVTVSNSCGNDIDSSVVSVNPITANISSNIDSVCQGESVQLTASGGDNYLWSPATGLSDPNIANPVATPAVPTTYTVSVTTAGGCSATNTINIYVSPNIVVTVTPDAICSGQTATLVASGGGSYLWSNSETTQSITVTPTTTTSYSVTVTSTDMLCTENTSASVIVYDLPNVYLGNDTSFCQGNNLLLNAQNNGSTFTWSDGSSSQTLTVSTTGIYSVTVTDANTCIERDTISVIVNSLPTAEAGNTSELTCLLTSVNLDASSSSGANPLSYQWNSLDGNIVSGSNTENPLINAAGTYNLTVTDNNGCVNTDNVIITSNTTPPTADAGNTFELTCLITSTNLDASSSSGSSLSYNWSTSDGNIVSGSNTVNPTVDMSGTYSLTVTQANNGCTAVDNVVITSNITAPVSEAGNNQLLTCLITSVSLDGTLSSGTGLSYNWSTINGNIVSGANTTTATVDSPGIYYLELTQSSNGCTHTDSVLVTADTIAPVANAGNDGLLTCTVSSVQLDASNSTGNSLSYNWSTIDGNIVSGNGTSQITVDSEGSYSLTVTDGNNGCTNTDIANVSSNTVSPAADILTPSIITCNNPSIVIDASESSGNNLQFTWLASSGGNIVSGGNTSTPTISSSGTYSLTITNSVNGCTDIASVDVTSDLTQPVADAGQDKTICYGEATSLTATGGGTYTWNNGVVQSVSFTPQTTMTYTVTVTNSSNGCTDTDDVIVNVSQLPVITLGNNVYLCEGETTTLNAGNSGSTYLWSDGSSNQSLTIDTTGNYSVTVTNANGCSSSDDVNVTVNQYPEIDLGTDVTITEGDGVLLNSNGNSTYIYAWLPTTALNNPTSASPTAYPSETTTYYVTVSNAYGCMSYDTIVVNVEPPVITELIIYNIFTPNDDGKNDKWRIENIERYKYNKVQVFNRNGNLVFETEHYNNSSNFWDGKFNDNPVPATTYYYIVDLGDDSELRKGYVTIVR